MTLGGIVQVAQEQVEHVAHAGGGVAHAMRQVQPALLRLDRRRAEAVLAFLDRVIKTRVNDSVPCRSTALSMSSHKPQPMPSPLPVAAKSAMGRV